MVSAIQQAASFQPQSNSVYPVANGIRIREGRETLEIGYDGVAVYHAGDEDTGRYPVGNGKDLLPLVETTWRLAADTVGRWCGEARLYLMGIDREADGSLLVRYGYTLNGADVLLPTGPAPPSLPSPAARSPTIPCISAGTSRAARPARCCGSGRLPQPWRPSSPRAGS